MQPHYHPVIAPYGVQQKHILVLWCPGGQTRPYKAPVSLAKGNREFAYFIRKGPATVRAKHEKKSSWSAWPPRFLSTTVFTTVPL